MACLFEHTSLGFQKKRAQNCKPSAFGLKHFTTVQFSRFTNVMYLPCALVCARAVVGDNDILDRCARDLPLPSELNRQRPLPLPGQR